MKIIKFILISILVYLVSINCSAQSNNISENKDAYDFAHRKTNIKNIGRIAFTGVYVGSGILAYRFADMAVREKVLAMNSPFIKKIAYEVSPYGLGRNQWLACGTTAAISFLSGSKSLQKGVVVWAGSLIISDFFTNTIKNGTQRHRPNTGSDNNVFDGKHGLKKNQSFPSAHTSNAFATATALATVYKKEPAVVIVAYSLATIIGASRIVNNAHWTSDVLAGAAVGFFSAKAMYRFYNFAEKRIVVIVPKIGLRQTEISLSVRI